VSDPGAPPRTGAPPIPIMLCADDYGLAPGIGAAIRDLIELGRLSAASCMTVSPFWPEEAARMRPLADHADIGLHLTLTDQRALGPMPRLAPHGRLPGLRNFVSRAMRRALDRAEIAAEVERQLDAFEKAMGRAPSHLDGHQHVHQLPIVRDVVIELYQRRLAGSGTWLRYCDEPTGSALSRARPFDGLMVSLLGRRFARRARGLGIPGNRRFRGIRNFAIRKGYSELFRSYISPAPPGLLVMCHAGLSDAALRAADPVTDAREDEYRFFLSNDFPEALREAGVRLARFAAAARARAMVNAPAP